MSWRDHAACAGSTRDITLADVRVRHRQRVAADYCSGCPVKVQCAVDALEHGDVGVVRGGVFLSQHNQYAGCQQRPRDLLREVAACG